MKSFSLSLLLLCSCGLRHGSPQERSYRAEQKSDHALLSVDQAHKRMGDLTQRVEVLERLIQRVDAENKRISKRLEEVQQGHEMCERGNRWKK